MQIHPQASALTLYVPVFLPLRWHSPRECPTAPQGVPNSTSGHLLLNRIARDQHGEQSRLRETIRVWQDRVPEDEFCWEKLIDALTSMKMIRR